MPTYIKVEMSDQEYGKVLAHTPVEVIYDILDECTQLFGGALVYERSVNRKKLTSAVQAPELDG